MLKTKESCESSYNYKNSSESTCNEIMFYKLEFLNEEIFIQALRLGTNSIAHVGIKVSSFLHSFQTQQPRPIFTKGRSQGLGLNVQYKCTKFKSKPRLTPL